MATPLIRSISRLSHLRKAWHNLNKTNPLSHGITSQTVEQFGRELENNIKKIRKELLDGSFRFSPVRAKTIPKGETSKRGLRIYEICDRLVQKAIALKIEPILNKRYHLINDASFAYQKKKDIHQALMRMVSLYKTGRLIAFEADIIKFFDKVDREKLLKMVYEVLPDSSINQLLQNVFEQQIGNWDSLAEDEQELYQFSGIPQGGVLSPLFANVFLSSFDKKMLKADFGLVRYADDFVVLCRDFKEATDAYLLSVEVIEKDLGLEMHPLTKDNSGKTRIVRISQENFEFLGFRFDGQRLWPSKKKVAKILAGIRETATFTQNRTLLDLLSDLRMQITGWVASTCYADIEPCLKEIEKCVRKHVAFCMNKMGWNCGSNLTDKQYRFLGTKDLYVLLSRQRKRFSDEEKLWGKLK